MPQEELALMAHLLRRAGFGATREELEGYLARGYEATVEELVHPEDAPPGLEDDDLVRRYHTGQNNLTLLPNTQTYWVYRMIKTHRPLEEKLALFWHGIFATGYTKLNQPKAILNQVEMFRLYGLGSFDTLLVQLSKDPAMIFWLDNKDNHSEGVNENFGRELLELFSMGVGNYTEDDVRQCSRAFTGWTIQNAALHTARSAQDSVEPYARLDWQFQYREDDHDDGEKSFLGHTGSFNGEDIINIVCSQPATARFIARHLYNFFVADEPQVSAWETVPPQDPEAIATLMDAYLEHRYDIRSVLRVLFNSDFFKEAAFKKVKSPVELVVGAVRLAGWNRFPEIDDVQLGLAIGYMGQQLLDPPSVEGWHTGVEWITTGSLVDRVNFVVSQFADIDQPGVRSIIDRVVAQGDRISPEGLVSSCLDIIGPLSVSEDTRQELLAHASQGGELRSEANGENRASALRVSEMLQLVVSTREFQLA